MAEVELSLKPEPAQASLIEWSLKEHSILSMRDSELEVANLYELVQLYERALDSLENPHNHNAKRPPDETKSCIEDFGSELISRWRLKKQSYCVPSQQVFYIIFLYHPDHDLQEDIQGLKLNSGADCYLMSQSNHQGGGDNLCLFQNITVAIDIFRNDSLTRETIESYVNTKHRRQPYLTFPPNFIFGDCKRNLAEWPNSSFPGWNLDISLNGFTTADEHDLTGYNRALQESPLLGGGALGTTDFSCQVSSTQHVFYCLNKNS